MPTTSSYYNDLEYPTVNEDASTYGSIINTYLDGLLTKLRAISDRVLNAQTQLGNINRGVNAVDRINTTLAGRIGSSALLPGTNITLLPDPYSGTYSKTTTWPAYTSALSSFSLPTTQSEVANFDYQGFANALTTEVNRIEATVTQAEADILAAQKDTCRAKKYIDVYQTGGTTVRTSEFIYFYVNGIGQYQNTAWYDFYSYSYSNGILTAAFTLNTSVTNGLVGGQTPAQAHQTFVTEGMLANGTATDVWVNDGYAAQLLNLNTVFVYDSAISRVLSTFTNSGSVPVSVTWYPTSSTYQLLVSGQSDSTFWNSRLVFSLSKKRVIETTVYGTPDLTECENPTPPYFS